MAMTRKHFQQIADVLKFELAQANRIDSHEARLAVREIATGLAIVCKGANPNFNKAKFYEAVGLTSYGCLP